MTNELTLNVVFELLPVADEETLEISERTVLDEKPDVSGVDFGGARPQEINQVQVNIQISHDLHFTHERLKKRWETIVIYIRTFLSELNCK